MRVIQQGRGECDPRVLDACGGDDRGRCTAGSVCECYTGWTGPFCLAHEARDPILYDVPDTLADVGFDPPGVAPVGLFIGLTLLILLFVVAVQCRRPMQGWSPIPEVDTKQKVFRL